MATDITKIRNIGVVAHGGVGKTSLVEAMLFAAGAVTRLGRVDDGTTTTDFDPDEIKRKISLSTAVAYCDYRGHRLNLVDTPGYGDFVADARAGLRVVSAAVVVVDAVADDADVADLRDVRGHACPPFGSQHAAGDTGRRKTDAARRNATTPDWGVP